jgi:hypothetical protein
MGSPGSRLPLPVLFVAILLAASPALAARIDNNALWRDSDGQEIKAQGGCILEDGGVFHWIGPQFESSDFHFRALNHYTSSDLQTWKKQAPLLTPSTPGLSAVPIASTSWVGRPWVLKRGPGDYVMWLEGGKLAGSAYRNRFVSFHAASLPGPWTFATVHASLPDAAGTPYALGDLGAYHDASTGNAYLLYTFDKGEENGYQGIAKLSPDFLRVLKPEEGGVVAEFPKTEYYGQEAAALFKRGSTYYHIMSDTRGWRPSVTRYRTATRLGPASEWSALKEVRMLPTGDAYSFRTQHDFVLPIVGSDTTTYVYCGDRWSLFGQTDYDGALGRQAWFPLSFDAAGVPTLNAPGFAANGGDWTLDLATGRWSAGVTSLGGNAEGQRPVVTLRQLGRSTLQYHLSVPTRVTVSLFGSEGRRLAELERADKGAGFHSLTWNAKTNQGSGVRWIRLQAGNSTYSVPAVLPGISGP